MLGKIKKNLALQLSTLGQPIIGRYNKTRS